MRSKSVTSPLVSRSRPLDIYTILPLFLNSLPALNSGQYLKRGPAAHPHSCMSMEGFLLLTPSDCTTVYAQSWGDWIQRSIRVLRIWPELW